MREEMRKIQIEMSEMKNLVSKMKCSFIGFKIVAAAEDRNRELKNKVNKTEYNIFISRQQNKEKLKINEQNMEIIPIKDRQK